MNSAAKIQSRIVGVDVFRSQVLVKRQVQISFSKISNRQVVHLGSLPVLLFDDSFRVQLDDDSKCCVVDTHIQWEMAEHDAEHLTTLQKEYRNLNDEQSRLAVERQRYLDFVAFMESLDIEEYTEAELPEKIAFSGRNQVPEWLKLTSWVTKEIGTHKKKIRQVQKLQKDLTDRIALTNDRLKKENRAELEKLAACRKVAVLTLEMDSSQDHIEIDVSYIVPNAGWLPEYDFHVASGTATVELVLKGLVAQATGENWPSLPLVFSTADLNRSAELPRLDSWKIGKTQPFKKTGWRELPENLEALFEAYDQGIHRTSAQNVFPFEKLPAVPSLGNQAFYKESGSGIGGSKGSFDADSSGSWDFVEDAFGGLEMEAPAEAEYDDHVSMSVMAAPLEIREPEPKLKLGKKRMRSKRSITAKAMRSPSPSPPGAPQVLGKNGGIAPNRNALGYSSLRMKGPSSSKVRGQLKSLSVLEQMKESLAGKDVNLVEVLKGFSSGIASQTRFSMEKLALPDHAVKLVESAGHFAARYTMEGTSQVPSDGQLHSLTLQRLRSPNQIVYRTVPLIDTQVFQMAVLNNPLEQPLLAGPARVYLNGDFITTVPLKTTGPGKQLTVSLGIEQGIKVARNVHFQESTEGLLDRETVVQHHVEIEVRSNMDETVHVEVYERVPISHDKDVEIKTVKTEPEAEKYQQTERGRIVHGGLVFSLVLEPRETKVCTLVYRVAFGSKQVLVGGNRRD